MPRNDTVRFTSSAVKVPPFHQHHRRHDHHHIFLLSDLFSKTKLSFTNFVNSLKTPKLPFHQLAKLHNPPRLIPALHSNPLLLCSASLALTGSQQPDEDGGAAVTVRKGGGAHSEERVLISEVLVRNKDGEELERKDLEKEAIDALKTCRPNSALTVREVQEDVHRIIGSGYFSSCMPVAVDTRDGIRLVFQVEPNQEFQGLVCEGANVLPSKFIEDAFRDGYGKVVNIRRLDEVISSINGCGEPTVGKTRPETILRQLTTKKGQVYSMLQGKRDEDTVLRMGIMEDVSIVPQPAGDTGKVDLILNVVEREKNGGISAGGGISSGITSGPLAGLIGSCAITRRNLFGRNQKVNLSIERGQIDSIYRINYTDPWIEGDDKRTSRSIMIQNSRTPGTFVHGNQPDNSSLTIGRVTAGIEYSRPLRPKWSGTAGLIFQRAGARDDKGNPIIRDFYGSPLTASGNKHDDMLLAKLESVYTVSGDPASPMFVLNMEQGLPVRAEWLAFNRVTGRARKGLVVGPASLFISSSGGHVVGKFPPHEAFPIGGTNSVRGYEEGAIGSGRSYVVGCGELSFPLLGPVQGTIFADYGTDLGSGPTVPEVHTLLPMLEVLGKNVWGMAGPGGDPAGARLKPGSGYGYGLGVRVDSPLGPLRLEYAFNDQRTGRFHFGVGYRN
ncbi:hypothetical protein RJ639_008227 [Escallonia herrerae]|uniref:POTRA domain-containing protein n=1 Tax=Escallonia herrerae TaxID=1293975 RepID=A0AA89ASB0_9ASTE|nr:hypothetical protein RJ639_008227 [Escallonia herrerae]